MAHTRASLPHFHASVASEVVAPWDSGVLALARSHPIGTLLAVYNVTPTWRHVPGWVMRSHGLADSVEALSGARVAIGDDDTVALPPYAVAWFVAV